MFNGNAPHSNRDLRGPSAANAGAAQASGKAALQKYLTGAAKVFTDDMKNYPLTTSQSVLFFGSSRDCVSEKAKHAVKKAAYLVSKNGLTVIAGGGPSIMEAASFGAYVGAAQSGKGNIPLNVQLASVKEFEDPNDFGIPDSVQMFEARKLKFLSSSICGYVIAPGGYGTLDELFEVLLLMDRGMLKRAPIMFIDGGVSFYDGLHALLKSMADEGFIRKRTFDCLRLCKSPKEVAMIAVDWSKKNPLPSGIGAQWISRSFSEDLGRAFHALSGAVAPLVSIVGASQVSLASEYARLAHDAAVLMLGQGYTVCTAGHNGVVSAVASAAQESGRQAIIFHLKSDGKNLEHEYSGQKVVPMNLMLSIKYTLLLANGAIFVPGGAETHSILYETLVKGAVNHMAPVPTVLLSEKFWGREMDWLEQKPLASGLIHAPSQLLLSMADSAEEAVSRVKEGLSIPGTP